MAINLLTQYPTGADAASGDWPFGEPRNITAPGDGLGTPWEAALVKEIVGLQQALLTVASITPSGTPDTALTSQYLQALVEIASGRAVTYTGGGVVNAYTATPVGDMPAPAAYFTGMTVEIDPAITTPGGASIDVAGLGVKAIVDQAGQPLAGGELTAGVVFPFRYNGVSFEVALLPTVKTKYFDMGFWDMDATVSVSIVHGLPDHLKIKSINAFIFADGVGGQGAIRNWSSGAQNATTDHSILINSTQIILTRGTNGDFDNVTFDNPGINRGVVKIEYTG